MVKALHEMTVVYLGRYLPFLAGHRLLPLSATVLNFGQNPVVAVLAAPVKGLGRLREDVSFL